MSDSYTWYCSPIRVSSAIIPAENFRVTWKLTPNKEKDNKVFVHMKLYASSTIREGRSVLTLRQHFDHTIHAFLQTLVGFHHPENIRIIIYTIHDNHYQRRHHTLWWKILNYDKGLKWLNKTKIQNRHIKLNINFKARTWQSLRILTIWVRNKTRHNLYNFTDLEYWGNLSNILGKRSACLHRKVALIPGID